MCLSRFAFVSLTFFCCLSHPRLIPGVSLFAFYCSIFVNICRSLGHFVNLFKRGKQRSVIFSSFAFIKHFCLIIIPPFPYSQAAPDVVEEVKREIEAVKAKISQNSVVHCLQFLRQLLSRPPGAFDAHAAMAALEHLSDVARENGDELAPRYNAILKQTRGLSGNPAIQHILLKLLETKEEIAIANEIEKATKNSSASLRPLSGQVSSTRHLPAPSQPYPMTCFACGLRGHTARNCRARRGRRFQRI